MRKSSVVAFLFFVVMLVMVMGMQAYACETGKCGDDSGGTMITDPLVKVMGDVASNIEYGKTLETAKFETVFQGGASYSGHAPNEAAGSAELNPKLNGSVTDGSATALVTNDGKTGITLGTPDKLEYCANGSQGTLVTLGDPNITNGWTFQNGSFSVHGISTDPNVPSLSSQEQSTGSSMVIIEPDTTTAKSNLSTTVTTGMPFTLTGNGEAYAFKKLELNQDGFQVNNWGQGHGTFGGQSSTAPIMGVDLTSSVTAKVNVDATGVSAPVSSTSSVKRQ